jgi:CheY-like chemotaxis protein
VYLPASLEQVAVGSNPAVPHTGSGTIIVVDDELVMRETIAEMLDTLGYRVLCTTDGNEALIRLAEERAASRTVMALFCDLTIPGGLGGVETVARIRATDPQLPVFVISGYADDQVMKNPLEYGFTASICKPFRKSDLAGLLEKHLKAC